MLDEPTLRACDAMAQEPAAGARKRPPSLSRRAQPNPSPQSIFRPTPSDSMT